MFDTSLSVTKILLFIQHKRKNSSALYWLRSIIRILHQDHKKKKKIECFMWAAGHLLEIPKLRFLDYIDLVQ